MDKPNVRHAEKFEVRFDEAEAVRRLTDVERPAQTMLLCACHPNDILSRVAELCRYERRTPVLEAELVSRACRDHFTEL